MAHVPARLDGAPATVQDLQALALVNYGHFTTMRVESGGVRGLSLHLDRLVSDCRAVFGADLDRDRVRGSLGRALRGARAPLIARVTVFDPALGLAAPEAAGEPHVLVTTRPPGPPAPPGTARRPRLRTTPEAQPVAFSGATLRAPRPAAPAGTRPTMGLDPGLRTGVKVAVVDSTGKVAATDTIYPHAPAR
ncbi:aminotransferase class IV, partial [Streptomyces sp. SBT349]|uniref:aminotransferase class IV n=1 Tax=Streptomyces sp. SBT349 TaxID=1580539 RepID=UPI00069DE8B9